MSFYQIINHIVEVKLFNPSKQTKLTHWTSFAKPVACKADFQIEFVDPIEVSRDVNFFRGPSFENLMFAGNAMMCADKSYKNAYVFHGNNADAFEIFSAYLFYTHAVRNQSLWIHSATINVDGRGILFIGPSGIGKTTQAECWAQYRNAEIINGDVGYVQRTEKGYFAWGTPWHGSSPYCINTSVPLKALVVLKQSPSNSLRELTGFEKVMEVSESVLYPTWIEDGVELCVDTLNQFLLDLPVYRLDNCADEKAVELLEIELNKL